MRPDIKKKLQIFHPREKKIYVESTERGRWKSFEKKIKSFSPALSGSLLLTPAKSTYKLGKTTYPFDSDICRGVNAGTNNKCFIFHMSKCWKTPAGGKTLPRNRLIYRKRSEITSERKKTTRSDREKFPKKIFEYKSSKVGQFSLSFSWRLPFKIIV